MKVFIILLFVTILIWSVVSNEDDVKHRKKHGNKEKKRQHEKHKYEEKKHHHENKKSPHKAKNHHGDNGNHLSRTNRLALSVTVNLGNNRTIRGTANETITTRKPYSLFQGIPYARPPVGNLRFEPPQEYDLPEYYEATYQRSICIQNSAPFGNTITGTEDCLYLNIYTPSTSNNAQLPVLVWIHGGGFLFGSGNYESYAPDNFIDQNLLVVTLNYRLGVFGFMSTGDDVVPGNMGLKDQVMALKWINKHIEAFGGNPKNITIMGESAGGASVAYVVQSPTSKGLFQQAIAHSGNSLCPWSLSRRAVENFRLLQKKLFILGTNDNKEIVRRMKNVTANDLSQLSSASMSIILVKDPLNGLVYAPVIEAQNPTAFFTELSYEQLSDNNFIPVPLIIGYNSEEFGGLTEINGILRLYLAQYDLIPRNLVPLDMNVNTTAERDKIGAEIKNLYVGPGTITLSNGTAKYASDDLFVRPTTKYAELFSQRREQPVYLYRFSYSEDPNRGVYHAGELQYFFYTANLTDGQREISRRVVTLWSNFIKFGDPTHFDTNDDTNDTINVTWEPTSVANNYSYIDLGEEFVFYNQSMNPDRVDLDHWEYWYDNSGNRPFDTY